MEKAKKEEREKAKEVEQRKAKKEKKEKRREEEKRRVKVEQKPRNPRHEGKRSHKKRKHEERRPSEQKDQYSQRTKNDAIEQLEGSGLTEEHELLSSIGDKYDASPESSQDSNKRRKLVSSSISGHNKHASEIHRIVDRGSALLPNCGVQRTIAPPLFAPAESETKLANSTDNSLSMQLRQMDRRLEEMRREFQNSRGEGPIEPTSCRMPFTRNK
ncbi:hypothetical protein B296_00039857 [Ensete ventricosum]|uniref:Uncharacterized protein n=1 Tax=Ensete ventricosum TaxID=4639 RepID=A0A426ZS80_ENSVE|nr:hypothetical protein B296_00039857 [Ensete ventricosum]